MKKLFWLAILITILAAFFASAYPDGLDFVAEKFGFAIRGQGHSVPSLFPDLCAADGPSTLRLRSGLGASVISEP